MAQHLKALGEYPAEWARPSIAKLRVGLERVASAPKAIVEQLHAWLQDKCRTEVDVEEVTTFGTLLTDKPQLAQLPRAYGVDGAIVP